MIPDIARDCPPDHRFLVQLVDAECEPDARGEIADMFGVRVAVKAVYWRGSCKLIRDYGPNRFAPLDPDHGFRVYLPKGVKL